MARKGEQPAKEGCKGDTAPFALCGLFRTRAARLHCWEYSVSWNGNDPDVVPFVDHQHGIARSGWRCHHCAEFAWDQSNLEFALSLAHRWHLVEVPKR